MLNKILNNSVFDENDCLVWKRSLRNGYACVRYNNKTHYGHRIMWELFYGTIPEGKLVCHSCDNRPCCNPEHLFLGTYKDNNHDAALKGRTARGEKQHIAKLTKEDVINIRNDKRLGTILSKELKVSVSTISKIRLKQRWAWL
jgi:hypothetical protein